MKKLAEMGKSGGCANFNSRRMNCLCIPIKTNKHRLKRTVYISQPCFKEARFTFATATARSLFRSSLSLLAVLPWISSYFLMATCVTPSPAHKRWDSEVEMCLISLVIVIDELFFFSPVCASSTSPLPLAACSAYLISTLCDCVNFFFFASCEAAVALSNFVCILPSGLFVKGLLLLFLLFLFTYIIISSARVCN